MRRPLKAGEPVTYWRLGRLAESRYDVADQPMSGEMDPFFFRTKHKNFIPHEYPCRTGFAAGQRDRRPVPVGVFDENRLWLPFGSPRVDLSGFWFRPTRIGAWAMTSLRATAAGRARLRLRTCGGAILFVNGAEVGWMARYQRNLETDRDFDAALVAGDNEIRIWFDDLAERDARYYFQLDYLSGPECAQSIPVSVEAGIADAVETLLDGMHFERPAYDGGEVALVADRPLPVDADVEIRVEGDFMSIEKELVLNRRLGAGATRIAIADTAELPADFRHFKVTLAIGAFSASRVFGVEICHARRQGPAPRDLAARIDEALGEVASHGETDSVRALACLAIGRTGPETDAMIEAALPPIEDCHDCADFILVPLLWCRKVHAGSIAPQLVARIDAAILGYRYWMDEPGNDVQWYFSENHALLFHTAAYLAGAILPEARFVRSRRLGAEQSAVGAGRVRAWLDHFEKWEMAEFNSAPYFPIDLKGLCILQALAPDADIRARAGAAIVRLATIVARSAHHGILTGAQGRSYEHTLRASRSLELSAIARLLWGKGNYGKRFHALPQLAICLRDHGLVVPPILAGIASLAAGEAQEWVFAQGQDRFARLYHYKTSAFALGTAAAYRWREWGYQETVLHLRLGDNPDAQIWINHPGEVLQSGYGRPSYWGGSGTLPRVQQYRGLAIVVFDCHAGQPGFTHAWFPTPAFDQSRVEGDLAWARGGKGCVVLKADRPFSSVSRGPTAGFEIRVEGRKATWIVRAGGLVGGETMEEYAIRFAGLAVRHGEGDEIRVADPQYGEVRFHGDGSVSAEGKRIDPRQWTVAGNSTRFVEEADRQGNAA
jgi:hypothetical protein